MAPSIRLCSVRKGESVDELIELRLSRPSYQGLSTCILAKSPADVRCLQTVLAHRLKIRVGTRACIRREQLWLLKRDGCVCDWEPRRFFPVRISGARVLLSLDPEQAKSIRYLIARISFSFLAALGRGKGKGAGQPWCGMKRQKEKKKKTPSYDSNSWTLQQKERIEMQCYRAISCPAVNESHSHAVPQLWRLMHSQKTMALNDRAFLWSIMCTVKSSASHLCRQGKKRPLR